MSQPLFELDRHKIRLMSPSFETLCNKVMCESFELFIRVLHLVVLCVENNTLLNLFYIRVVKDVVTNAKLFNAEICFESVSNGTASFFVDGTVENL